MKFSLSLQESQVMLRCMRSIARQANQSEIASRIVIKTSCDSVSFIVCDDHSFLLYYINNVVVENPFETSVLFSNLQNFLNSFVPYSEESGGVKDVLFKLNDKSLGVNVKNYDSGGGVTSAKIRLPVFFPMYDNSVFELKTPDFTLSSSMLRAAIDKAQFAIDPTHSIDFLRGMNIKFTEDYIYLAGTNGIVISEQSVNNTSGVSSGEYLLPYAFVKSLRSILSSLSKEESQVEFSVFSNGVIKTKVNSVIFVSPLIKGCTYPDYRAELLKEKCFSIVVSKSLLLSNLVPIIGLIDSDDNYRITIHFYKGGITFITDLSEIKIVIDSTLSTDIKVDVNGKYFKEIINSIKDDKLIISFTDSSSPIVFDSETFKDQKTLLSTIRRRNL